ncbi:MAG: MlaD family protein [Myxococcota bacterium]
MQRDTRRTSDVLLGAFVLLGLLIAAVMVVLVGRQSNLLTPTAQLQARFSNVSGLALGAEVQLSGVEVGQVKAIQFPDWSNRDKASSKITVTMSVSKKMLAWIRQDSVVRVSSKGLLGEKTINISIGSPHAAAVNSGDLLQSMDPMDLSQAFDQAQEVLAHVTRTAAHIRKLFDELIKQDGGKMLAQSVLSVKNILREVEQGGGLIHQLIYAKQAGSDYQKIMQDLAKTAGRLESIMQDVREQPGILHSLLYEKQGAEVIDSLQGTLADLRHITSRIKEGEGSLGRLLTDTSVYEDLKLILGNVRRNKVLKALIRYAISRQEGP